MVHFHAIGHIATDIVRKETRDGVTASFRLCSGVPGQSRLWITVEATGHTAGRLHTHGHIDRAVMVAGQLSQRTWRDRTTQQERHRFIVIAASVELLPTGQQAALHNHTIAHGRLTHTPSATEHTDSPSWTLVSGRTGSTAGKTWLPLSTWEHTRGTKQLTAGETVTAAGRLAYNKNNTQCGYHLLAQLVALAPRSSIV